MARLGAILGCGFSFGFLCWLILLCNVGLVNGYNANACCNLAKDEGAFVGLVSSGPPSPNSCHWSVRLFKLPLLNRVYKHVSHSRSIRHPSSQENMEQLTHTSKQVPDNQTCGQSYELGLPPAEPLFISYSFCSSRCSGIQLSNVTKVNEWIAPIAQFVMPSIIFSMTIPRRMKIEFATLFEFQWPKTLTRFGWLNSFVQLFISLLCFTIILIPVAIDTIIWIAVIIVGAGNMLVGGLYEAHLDYRIVNYVRNLDHGTDEGKLRMKRELLVTVTSGNLLLENGNPQVSIPRSITIPGLDTIEGDQSSRFRLLNLLGSQSSFGGTVGSPVLFYLAPFIYTILDLLQKPSDEDSAISLSFGIELMVSFFPSCPYREMNICLGTL